MTDLWILLLGIGSLCASSCIILVLGSVEFDEEGDE